MTYRVHTPETAPAESRELLREVKANLGVLPNLAAAMAESPPFAKSFFTVRSIYSGGTLGEGDRQLLSIANAVENGCTWCVAFHSMLAEKAGVAPESVAAVRSLRLPTDARDRALATFTQELIRNRGHVSPDAFEAFRAAGFTPAQALEVVLGVAFSTMANYAQHLVRAPLDDMLAPYAWVPPA